MPLVGSQRIGAVHELLVEGFELRLDDDLIGFLVNREVLEDGQVEQPALGLAGEVVGPLVGVNQEEGFIESGHDVIDLVLGGLCPLLDLGLLGGDAGLFGPQHVFGNGVAVEELDELLLLGGQLAQAAGMALALGPGDLGALLDGGADGFPNALTFLDGEPVVGVDDLEPVFDELQPDVAGAAGSARRDPAEAGVVLVVGTELAAMPAVAVAFAAPAADDLAGQVVVVLAAAAAAGPVAGEDGLDAVEGLLVDELLMATPLLDAAVGDDAEVVVAAQQAMHGGGGQRLGGPRGGRRGCAARPPPVSR